MYSFKCINDKIKQDVSLLKLENVTPSQKQEQYYNIYLDVNQKPVFKDSIMVCFKKDGRYIEGGFIYPESLIKLCKIHEVMKVENFLKVKCHEQYKDIFNKANISTD